MFIKILTINANLLLYHSNLIWIISSAVLSIFGGILLYFTLFDKKNDNKFNGFLKMVYDIFTFKKNILETIIRILYIICTIYITLSSFAFISINFLYFILRLFIGNIIIRILFEFLLMIINICNKYLAKDNN